jgi:hypothetical protein
MHKVRRRTRNSELRFQETEKCWECKKKENDKRCKGGGIFVSITVGMGPKALSALLVQIGNIVLELIDRLHDTTDTDTLHTQ